MGAPEPSVAFLLEGSVDVIICTMVFLISQNSKTYNTYLLGVNIDTNVISKGCASKVSPKTDGKTYLLCAASILYILQISPPIVHKIKSIVIFFQLIAWHAKNNEQTCSLQITDSVPYQYLCDRMEIIVMHSHGMPFFGEARNMHGQRNPAGRQKAARQEAGSQEPQLAFQEMTSALNEPSQLIISKGTWDQLVCTKGNKMHE